MGYWRKTALTGLVWLTAAAIALAGVPHFTCLCPDGRFKIFCLNISSNNSGCCCGGKCCSAGKSCCQGGTCCAAKKSGENKDRSGQAQSAGCLKTVAGGQIFTKADSK